MFLRLNYHSNTTFVKVKSGFIDCFPSHSAFAGLLCTSIISPSAPTAIAAFASGSTKSRSPVAWDGSIIIGRCDFCFITGIYFDGFNIFDKYIEWFELRAC